MKNYIKELRSKFNKYEIDGYVIPKNDDYFTEYSKLNRLEIISNFSGSAGLAIILKNKNYLFTDVRYTIQSQIESGKNFKIYGFEKLMNCSLFKNLTLGIDPKLFTNTQIKNYFLKYNKIKSIEEKGQNGLEEERRLAYVGITRAKKKAIISFSMNRFYQGDWIDSMASRFIDELPEKHLEKNSFFDDEINNDDDFEFNQDFEIEEGTRSPGWIRYQKRIK